MAVRESVKLTKEEVLEFLKPVSREEFDMSPGTTVLEKMNNIRNKRKNNIVNNIAMKSKYHPLGYGAWDMNISKKQDGEFYAEWSRSETCD